MRRALGVCAALALAASSAVADVVNGGFESGDFSGWTLNNNGGTANVLSGGAPEGQKYAEIIAAASAGAGAADVVLQQDFAGEAGDLLSFTYALSVSMSPPAIANGCFTATNNTTGRTLFDYCLTGSTPWLSESYPLTEAGSYTLKFHAAATPSAAAGCEARIGIDNVRLTPVPEPGTVALLAGMLACVLVWLRHLR
jgi:hypothetical protein